MRSLLQFFLFILVVIFAAVSTAESAALPACDPDNGGIKLPPGFCALVVAENLGTLRHITVAPNGDVYVALRRPKNGAVLVLRDSKGTGRLDVVEGFGDQGATGIAIRNGYLYIATPVSVLRYKMISGQLK